MKLKPIRLKKSRFIKPKKFVTKGLRSALRKSKKR